MTQNTHSALKAYFKMYPNYRDLPTEGLAAEVCSFLRRAETVHWTSLMNEVPTGPATLYIMAQQLIDYPDVLWCKNILELVQRLPTEFQVLILRSKQHLFGGN